MAKVNKDAYERIGEYQANLEAMRTMVVVMTGEKGYSLQRDDELVTGYMNVDEQRIVITAKCIPEGLPQWKKERLLDGLGAHEAGHVVVTTPYDTAYNQWTRLQKYPILAAHIVNVFEDLRVNFYVEHRYRFDFGLRMKAYHEACIPSMVKWAKELPLEKKRLEKALIILTLKVLADIDLTDHLDSEAEKNVLAAAEIMKTAMFRKVLKDLLTAVEGAYWEIEKLINRPAKSKKPRRDIDIGEQTIEGDHSKDEPPPPSEVEEELGIHGKLTIEEDFIEPEEEADPGKRDYDLSDLEVDDKRKVKPEPPLDSTKEDASKGEGEGEDAEETAGEDDEGENAGVELDDAAKKKLEELAQEIKERKERWDGGSYENYDRDVDESVIPNYMGGQMPLTATREEIDAAKAQLARMKEAAREEAERAAELAREMMSEGGEASGISTGVGEPKIEANEPRYSELVRKNTPYISRLLNYLKQLQTVTWSTARFARRGRYMIEMHPVFRVLAGGKGKPFDRRFEGHTRTIDKVKCKMALLVDMSGSMNTEQARDALTVISETAGRWLPSEDFAIAVFGSNHALVKAFVEPYNSTRARIGGVYSMGGTMPVKPLSVLIKMLASFRRSNYALILVIVSDFQIPPYAAEGEVSESEETKRLIREAEKLGIKVIGVGLCSGDLSEIQGYVKRSTFVSHVRELPILFFKLYRRAVTGMVT